MQNPTQQKRKFTTYERDANGRDEAQQRSYSAWLGRFDQPDPYDGSYDLSDPQSLNRYAYVNNDPVNFVDPSGLIRYIGPAPTVDPLYLRFLFFTPRGDGEGTGGSQRSGPCITQAVQGERQLARRNILLSPDGKWVTHDGWHIVAPPGTEVTTLAELQGKVLGIRAQGDGTYAVDVLTKSGVAIYKDLQKPTHLRQGQQLGTGALIGKIGISGESQGLHFTMLRGGETAHQAFRKITSGIGSLEEQLNSAYERRKSPRRDAYIQSLYAQQLALRRQLTPDKFYTNLADTPVGNCP